MRKLLRKHLPDPSSLREMPLFRLFGNSLLHPRLWHLNRHSAAGGLAVGLVCGLIPGPLQILSAAIVCVVLRVNLPVAVFGTLFTNPLTIVPLYALAVALGCLVTGGTSSFTTPPEFVWEALPVMLDTWWRWLLSLGRPLLLGLLLLGALLGGSAYFGVRLAWESWLRRARRRRRAERAAREAAAARAG